MPSSTPNFNWPYPISTDDLNAGATEIGNLANAADTTMATRAPLNSPALTGNPTAPTQATSENSTRIATTAYVKNNLNNYATSNLNTIEAGYFVVTTNSGGFANMPPGYPNQGDRCAAIAWGAGAFPFINVHAASTTQLAFTGLGFSYGVVPSTAIGINLILWT